jgi:acyl carrier protein
MPIDIQDTKLNVLAIIMDKLQIDESSICDNSTLQDLGADSLDLVEIVMALEDEFSIEISDEDAEKLENIVQVVEYVHKKRNN